MDAQEYRSRRGRILVDDAGITVIERGAAALFVPWYTIGHMQSAEVGSGQARLRVIRIHLAVGRTIPLPAPTTDNGAGESFDQAAAKIFSAWRDYGRDRLHSPHDAIPPTYRAQAARRLDPDPVRDAVPDEDATIQDAVPATGASILRRWLRRRAGR